MKAFLSHSSIDKSFIDQVVKLLRPGTYELDALTFDKGSLNVSEILESLKRSDLFCLFLSKSSIASKYVDFEQNLAFELLGAGGLNSFLTFCLDSEAFSDLTTKAKLFNAVRQVHSPEAVAHIINGKLISIIKQKEQESHPFIGRDQEIKELEEQCLDFTRPKTKALFISGNFGVGRKAIAEHFVFKQYPNVLKSYPKLQIQKYAGFDEIYRHVIASIRPSATFKEFADVAENFSKKTDDEKANAIAAEINELIPTSIVLFVIDAGGLLQESGAFSPEIENIVNHIQDDPYPPVVFISPRMVPRSHRRKLKDTVYLAVGKLDRQDTVKLVSWAVRSLNATVNQSQVDKLVELADFHPYNVYEIRDRIREIGIEAFLSNTAAFQAWKHKETSDYVRSVNFNTTEKKILEALLFAPELDFRTLIEALQLSAESLSESIQNLIDIHVLQFSDDLFSISSPLRIAIERDPRLKQSKRERSHLIRQLASVLQIATADGTAPVALADAMILTTLEASSNNASLASALLLPSHRVWLAQRHYDAARWDDCKRLVQDAVKDKSRLSVQGYRAACTLLCLSAARLRMQDIFEEGISRLSSVASDNWGKADVSFLKGFNARMQGRILEAFDFLTEAYKLNDNDRSIARELASVSLALGRDQEAQIYARKAYDLASYNPYTVDILVSALIRALGPKCIENREMNFLLERLKTLDSDEQKSFYLTRKSEIEYLYGDLPLSESLIATAVKKTPYIFEPKLLQAKIFLRRGNLPSIKEKIKDLEGFLSNPARSEDKIHRRNVKLLKVEYLCETKQFSEARQIFNDNQCFSEEERSREIQKIDSMEAYSRAAKR